MHQTTPPTAAQTVSLTGVRLTRGNAVDCPRLRDDAGHEYGVSYLSPAVAIGARVSLRGVWGISTRCRGRVLMVQQECLVTE